MKCWMVSYEFPLRFHGLERSTAEKWLAPQGPYDIRTETVQVAGVYNRSCWLPKHKNLSTHDKKIMNSRWVAGCGQHQSIWHGDKPTWCGLYLEDWVQKFRRAGRDGWNAEGMCALLYIFVLTYTNYHCKYVLHMAMRIIVHFHATLNSLPA